MKRTPFCTRQVVDGRNSELDTGKRGTLRYVNEVVDLITEMITTMNVIGKVLMNVFTVIMRIMKRLNL